MDAENKRKAVKRFTRFINQHINKMCKENNLDIYISPSMARNSFASNFVNSGASLVDTLEAMGHSHLKTTEGYLQSLDEAKKKRIADSMMDFDNIEE